MLARRGFRVATLDEVVRYGRPPIRGGAPLSLSNSFEGGSSGTTVSTGNSGGTSGAAFDAVSIGTSATCKFGVVAPAHGAGLDMEIVQPATVVATYVQWSTSLGTLVTSQTIGGRMYFQAPTATVGSTWRVFQVLTGATVLCGVAFGSGTNNVQFRGSGDTSVGPTTATAISANTLYRVEWSLTGIGGGAAAGGGSIDLFLGDSTTPVAGMSISTSAVNFGSTAPDTVRFGFCTANSVANSTFVFDGLNVNDTGKPGPESTGPVPPPVQSTLSATMKARG